ncbi:1,4-beta-xylanase [Maribacter sp. 2307UL18-2]|uniref:1,4-beta-xylanase n=1 Tax=Maribacter sp. 2307UL18-2 TaxID=3386274 RepID=UPI0039BD90B1
MRRILLIVFAFIVASCVEKRKDVPTEKTAEEIGLRWSEQKAWDWYNEQPWLVGTNFNPSTAINQLEFWQADTFDPQTIERELKWSADLGMNLHRVYLHNLLWKQDSVGFLNRLEDYLKISNKYGIKTMFVLLDDVWHPVPKLGKQPEPVPHVHNSGWVQAPGAEILGDTTRHDELKGYVKGVLDRFKSDDRVLLWDVYNEPDNVAGQPGRKELEVLNKQEYSLALLKKVMHWSRSVNPSQPLTSGIWRGTIDHWGTPDSLPTVDRYMIENSDVISFHAYDGDTLDVKRKIQELKKYKRPLLCTEYIARGVGNTFQAVMPIFKANNIAAINWGFVSGKTNTIYPWISWDMRFTDEPEIWHHDILREDGTPYKQNEVDFIREIITSE